MPHSAFMRLLIAAARKSSGKTVIAIGLAAALADQGLKVQPFKKGPDYIDAGWLSLAAGAPCYNLDFNVQSHDEMLAALARTPQECFKLIEANKGLHDGLSTEGENSNAALAKLLKLPVVLVLDCTGITRGVAPLLLGQQLFDREVQLVAVILNQVRGARHEQKLKAAVKAYTDVKVVGTLPYSPQMQLPERHLGLMPAAEALAARAAVDRMRQYASKHLSLDELIGMARNATPLSCTSTAEYGAGAHEATRRRYRLGVFRDAAFSFYYPDDLEALSHHGFELVFINSLRDNHLPPIDALFIGGGFPETQMKVLSANEGLRRSVRSAIEDRLPVYAECGGLMYLARKLEWRGRCHVMADVLHLDIVVEDTPQGRGYARIEEDQDMPWPRLHDQHRVHPAHEFHYSRIVSMPDKLKTAYKVLRGTGIGNQRDGIVYKNLLASYIHRRSSKQHDWTKAFFGFVHRQKTCPEA